ncbi:MAG: hypothetical protein ACR2G0_12900 [Chthoniobacterales bacterium]
MKTFFFLLLSFGVMAGQFASGGETSPTQGSTGVEGVLKISPVRGGPTRQGESDSAPLPHMSFEVKQDGQSIQSFQTDDQGRFRVLLKPGHYTVVRKDWKSAVGSYGPFEVEVNPGKMSEVEWKCDSGMR